MNKNKSLYEAPTTEVFVVQTEGTIMDASPLQTLGLMTIGGGDQGFGDSAADIVDKSDQSWW